MKPQTNTILEMFQSAGAYLQGHFQLTSGLHSGEYLQCAQVLQHPEMAAKLGYLLAEELRGSAPEKIDVVVSPALGGLIIGHEVARCLGTRLIFTERDAASKRMMLRRGFSIARNERAVVVEDVITTGGSTREVVEVLRESGGKVLAAGSIIDRSGGQAAVGVPGVALATLQVASYHPAECPLCRRGVPIVKPGSRPS